MKEGGTERRINIEEKEKCEHNEDDDKEGSTRKDIVAKLREEEVFIEGNGKKQ